MKYEITYFKNQLCSTVVHNPRPMFPEGFKHSNLQRDANYK